MGGSRFHLMALNLRAHLLAGQVVPALPLALTRRRRWDEARQRAVIRYYVDAGAGGLAVGVHSTQFAIRDAKVGLYEPVLALAAETAREWLGAEAPRPFVLIAGLCGRTVQACREAQLAAQHGYHAGLLSLGAWARDDERTVLRHCRTVARELPLIGFYLQPAVGGRVFSYKFWRALAEIPPLVAVKIAPFHRYQTLDVVRAVAESGRTDIALYTGNDDNIIVDLLTPFRFGHVERRIVGGLLGHWAVWTKRAVEQLNACHAAAESRDDMPLELLRRSVEVTDANAAFFDAANGFGGCIPGIHEVLRRQGLLEGLWTLDPAEQLGPGQKEEIDRVYRAYPHLNDDDFVAAHRDEWLKV